MSYLLKITEEAEKEVRRLDNRAQKRVRGRFRELSLYPFDDRISKPLKMLPGKRAARVGPWRIIYEVNEPSMVIEILAVRPRSRAYK